MKTAIGKQFKFHAAHQLPNHDGACARPHGHTYTLEVVCYGYPNPVNGDPDEGMVIDFGRVKEAYESKIEPFVEHQDLNDTLKHVVPVTTCEHIAQWIYKVLCSDQHVGRIIKSVTVWETQTSWSRVGT